MIEDCPLNEYCKGDCKLNYTLIGEFKNNLSCEDFVSNKNKKYENN